MEENELAARVVEDVRDVLRGQANVDGIQDAAGLYHAKVTFEKLVSVVSNERRAIPFLHSERTKRVRQPVRPLSELRVRELLLAINDADLFGKQRLGAIPKLQWCQWDEHRHSSLYFCGTNCRRSPK